MTERFTIALVGAPFGLSGRVKMESVSGEDGHLLTLQKAMLRLGGIEREYTVETVFTSPLSVKFAGIDSPEAAKTLRGAELLAPRAEAAPLRRDEFYIEDLKGLEVFTAPAAGSAEAAHTAVRSTERAEITESTAGTIVDLIEGGGGFLAEVRLLSGEKRLVPFRNEFFGPLDPASGRVELLKPWILE